MSMPRYLTTILHKERSLLKVIRVLIGGDGATLCRSANQITFGIDVLPLLRERTVEEELAYSKIKLENNFQVSLLTYERKEERAVLEVQLERFVSEAR